MRNFVRFSVWLLFLLNACDARSPDKAVEFTLIPATETAVQAMDTTPAADAYAGCGYAWASEPLVELSRDFEKALIEEVQPQANGYAEAYGENCVNNQGEVIRFLAMETDFYISLQVEDLGDKQAMGEMVEQVLILLSAFPVEETPGPQPGYVGITFETPDDNLRMWFRQVDAETAWENGLRGEELFNVLQTK